VFASAFEREVNTELLSMLAACRSSIITVLGEDPLAGVDLNDLDAAVETLAVEYCRLFIGPHGHMPPVESVVLGEGKFWGASTESVAKFYQDNGMAPDEEARVVPDHISMELDCLATLEEQGRHDEAVAFAIAHPLRWLPLLTQHIESRASLAFYPVWSRGLQAMLEGLCDKRS
jgi:TorA maturation chaperone TorD